MILVRAGHKINKNKIKKQLSLYYYFPFVTNDNSHSDDTWYLLEIVKENIQNISIKNNLIIYLFCLNYLKPINTNISYSINRIKIYNLFIINICTKYSER